LILKEGLSGYNRIKNLAEVRVEHCWSHARREFFERIGDYPEEATKVVTLIDEIFALEAKAKSFEELRELRQTLSHDSIDRLKNYLLEVIPKYLPGSGINKAINYCLKFWKELTLFLQDLSLPLSNNDAELLLKILHILLPVFFQPHIQCFQY
jgi:transposase